MIRKSCDTCKYHSMQRCHRHAPIASNEEGNRSQAIFPATTYINWCGDWEASKAAIKEDEEDNE